MALIAGSTLSLHRHSYILMHTYTICIVKMWLHVILHFNGVTSGLGYGCKTNIFASVCIQNLVPLHDDYYYGLKRHSHGDLYINDDYDKNCLMMI